MTIATQTTLAALLAKLIAAPATEAKQDTGNTSLGSIVTNTTGLATAAGQTTAASSLATIATNTGNGSTAANQATQTLTGSSILTKLASVNLATGTVVGATSATVSGSITALNGTLDGSLDLAAYASVRIQVTGTFVATISFETSIDGTNWVNNNVKQASSYSIGANTAAAGLYYGDIGARYFRAKANAYTSGTAVVSIVYSAAASAVPTGALAATLQAGTALAGAVAIGSTTPSKITATSAATTNATSSKTTAGNLYEITVSNPSAATVYLKLYNKATAPTVGTDIPSTRSPSPRPPSSASPSA
jgi:hypothetical protein